MDPAGSPLVLRNQMAVENDRHVGVRFDAVQRVEEVVAKDQIGANLLPTVRPRLGDAIAHDADWPQIYRLARNGRPGEAKEASKKV